MPRSWIHRMTARTQNDRKQFPSWMRIACVKYFKEVLRQMKLTLKTVFILNDRSLSQAQMLTENPPSEATRSAVTNKW
jgi:hypothetical protein